MRLVHVHVAHVILQLAAPAFLFWKRSNVDERREAVFNQLYDVLAAVYESAAYLKPEWAERWDQRRQAELPPKFSQETVLPERTIDAVRELRYARSLLQRHRWRSVKQPLFAEIDPVAWAALQRRLQMVSVELLQVEEENTESLRQDESDWIARAVEGFDNARAYLRTAERSQEPLDRQVANSAYVAIHLAIQLSERLIERQRFEMSNDE